MTFSVDQILSSMQEIQAWVPLRRLLKDKSLPTGGSWEDIRAALTGAEASTIDLLVELYTELRIYGRKHVYLFSIPEDVRQVLLTQTPPTPESNFASDFPFPAKADGFVGPTLTRIMDSEDERCLIFCSHRWIDTQYPLEAKYLKDDVPEAIRSSRIKVMHRARQQAYDVVVVPKTPDTLVEIRIDNFDCVTEPKFPESLYQIRSVFNDLYNNKIYASMVPVNIHKAMDAIYSDPTEGKITEIEFMSPSGSYKKESLRMKREDDDLRVEAFHRAGKNAVGTIGIFRLGVTWTTDTDGTELLGASLLLPGTIRTLEDPVLFEARIPLVASAKAYRRILSRLSAIVSKIPTAATLPAVAGKT